MSRWTEDPSYVILNRLSPEELAAEEAYTGALLEFERTGDPTRAIEAGLLPADGDYETIRRNWGMPAKLPGVKY